jgi:cytoskeletal protein RodZ
MLEAENQSDLSESPGALLKKTRETKKISINEVAEKLCLSRGRIEDIEADCYQNIPFVYFQGYLKSYAQFLEIPKEQLQEVLRKSCEFEDFKVNNTSNTVKQTVLTPVYSQAEPTKKNWLLGLLASAFLLIVILVFAYMRNINISNSPSPVLVKKQATSAVSSQLQLEQIDKALPLPSQPQATSSPSKTP